MRRKQLKGESVMDAGGESSASHNMQPGIEDDAIPEDPGASETHLRELHKNSRLAFIKLGSPPS
jgi:hypothetical protein